MVFDKVVKLSQIEAYEHEIFEQIIKLPLIDLLKDEINKRNLSCQIMVYHTKESLKKYLSELIIIVYGEGVKCIYRPSGFLTLRKTLCFFRHSRVIGIDLSTNDDFLKSLESFVNEVKRINCDNDDMY